jgi:hypothetical protein
MRHTAKAIAGMAICAAFVFTALSPVLSADIARMTKDELRVLLDKGDVIVLDVRSGRDWKSSEFKIKTAVRENPVKVASWANTYPKDKTIVLYCA